MKAVGRWQLRLQLVCCCLAGLLLLCSQAFPLAADQRCLQEYPAAELQASCGNDTAQVRQQLVSWLLDCVADDKPQDVSWLLPDTGTGAYIAATAGGHVTQFKPTLLPVPSWQAAPVLELANASLPQQDSWILDTAVEGDLASANRVVDLTAIVAQDPRLRWYHLSRPLRSLGSDLLGRVVGVPLDAGVWAMYYRRDALDRLGLQVPQTWSELVEWARRADGLDWDGDGQPDYGICLESAPGCLSPYVLEAIWASIAQYTGTAQGFVWEPASLTGLHSSLAMLEALAIYQQLSRYSRPGSSSSSSSSTCSLVSDDFAEGRCAVTLGSGRQFKRNQRVVAGSSSSSRRWRVGCSMLPGSSEVLQRASGQLEPCNSRLCPFANIASGPDGAPQWVNRAPLVRAAGVLAGISSAASEAAQLASYEVIADLAGAESSWRLILDPGSETSFFRDEHLAEENLQRWLAAGFDSEDTASFLWTMRQVLVHGNMAVEPAMVDMLAYRSVLGTAATMIAQPGASLLDVISWMDRTLDRLMLEQIQDGAVGQAYRAWLGYNTWGMQGGGDGNGTDTGAGAVGPSPSSSTSHLPRTLGLGIGLGLGLPLTLLLGYVLVSSYVSGGSLLPSICFAMGGPRGDGAQQWLGGRELVVTSETSLLVTDIQDSTVLWEELPALIMDQSLKLHHKCIRKLVAKHGGYESATEGDSFILAFDNVEVAVMFAIEAQLRLLALTWPKELLQAPVPSVSTVWVRTPDMSPPHRRRSLAGLGRAPSAAPSFSRPPGLVSGDSVGTAHGTPSATGDLTSPLGGESFVRVRRRTSISSRTVEGFLNNNNQQQQHPLQHQPNTSTSLGLPSSGLVSPQDVATRSAEGEAPLGPDREPDTFQKHFRQLFERTEGLLEVEEAQHWVCMFCGLRVRMGIHTGPKETEISYNAASKRYTFSGEFILTTKAVADAAHGGQILCSDASFQHIPQELVMDPRIKIWHMGQHHVSDHLSKLVLYQVLSQELLARASLVPPLRSKKQLTCGVLEAPMGHLTLAVMHMVGVKTLAAWNTPLTSLAIKMYESCVGGELALRGGYMADSQGVPGAVVAAFTDPSAAILWSLHSIRALLQLPWPEELLHHELCERIFVVDRGSNASIHCGNNRLSPEDGGVITDRFGVAGRRSLSISAPSPKKNLGSNFMHRLSIGGHSRPLAPSTGPLLPQENEGAVARRISSLLSMRKSLSIARNKPDLLSLQAIQESQPKLTGESSRLPDVVGGLTQRSAVPMSSPCVVGYGPPTSLHRAGSGKGAVGSLQSAASMPITNAVVMQHMLQPPRGSSSSTEQGNMWPSSAGSNPALPTQVSKPHSQRHTYASSLPYPSTCPAPRLPFPQAPTSQPSSLLQPAKFRLFRPKINIPTTSDDPPGLWQSPRNEDSNSRLATPACIAQAQLSLPPSRHPGSVPVPTAHRPAHLGTLPFSSLSGPSPLGAACTSGTLISPGTSPSKLGQHLLHGPSGLGLGLGMGFGHHATPSLFGPSMPSNSSNGLLQARLHFAAELASSLPSTMPSVLEEESSEGGGGGSPTCPTSPFARHSSIASAPMESGGTMLLLQSSEGGGKSRDSRPSASFPGLSQTDSSNLYQLPLLPQSAFNTTGSALEGLAVVAAASHDSAAQQQRNDNDNDSTPLPSTASALPPSIAAHSSRPSDVGPSGSGPGPVASSNPNSGSCLGPAQILARSVLGLDRQSSAPLDYARQSTGGSTSSGRGVLASAMSESLNGTSWTQGMVAGRYRPDRGRQNSLPRRRSSLVNVTGPASLPLPYLPEVQSESSCMQVPAGGSCCVMSLDAPATASTASTGGISSHHGLPTATTSRLRSSTAEGSSDLRSACPGTTELAVMASAEGPAAGAGAANAAGGDGVQLVPAARAVSAQLDGMGRQRSRSLVPATAGDAAIEARIAELLNTESVGQGIEEVCKSSPSCIQCEEGTGQQVPQAGQPQLQPAKAQPLCHVDAAACAASLAGAPPAAATAIGGQQVSVLPAVSRSVHEQDPGYRSGSFESNISLAEVRRDPPSASRGHSPLSPSQYAPSNSPLTTIMTTMMTTMSSKDGDGSMPVVPVDTQCMETTSPAFPQVLSTHGCGPAGAAPAASAAVAPAAQPLPPNLATDPLALAASSRLYSSIHSRPTAPAAAAASNTSQRLQQLGGAPGSAAPKPASEPSPAAAPSQGDLASTSSLFDPDARGHKGASISAALPSSSGSQPGSSAVGSTKASPQGTSGAVHTAGCWRPDRNQSEEAPCDGSSLPVEGAEGASEPPGPEPCGSRRQAAAAVAAGGSGASESASGAVTDDRCNDGESRAAFESGFEHSRALDFSNDVTAAGCHALAVHELSGCGFTLALSVQDLDLPSGTCGTAKPPLVALVDQAQQLPTQHVLAAATDEPLSPSQLEEQQQQQPGAQGLAKAAEKSRFSGAPREKQPQLRLGSAPLTPQAPPRNSAAHSVARLSRSCSGTPADAFEVGGGTGSPGSPASPLEAGSPETPHSGSKSRRSQERTSSNFGALATILKRTIRKSSEFVSSKVSGGKQQQQPATASGSATATAAAAATSPPTSPPRKPPPSAISQMLHHLVHADSSPAGSPGGSSSAASKRGSRHSTGGSPQFMTEGLGKSPYKPLPFLHGPAYLSAASASSGGRRISGTSPSPTKPPKSKSGQQLPLDSLAGGSGAGGMSASQSQLSQLWGHLQLGQRDGIAAETVSSRGAPQSEQNYGQSYSRHGSGNSRGLKGPASMHGYGSMGMMPGAAAMSSARGDGDSESDSDDVAEAGGQAGKRSRLFHKVGAKVKSLFKNEGAVDGSPSRPQHGHGHGAGPALMELFNEVEDSDESDSDAVDSSGKRLSLHAQQRHSTTACARIGSDRKPAIPEHAADLDADNIIAAPVLCADNLLRMKPGAKVDGPAATAVAGPRSEQVIDRQRSRLTAPSTGTRLTAGAGISRASLPHSSSQRRPLRCASGPLGGPRSAAADPPGSSQIWPSTNASFGSSWAGALAEELKSKAGPLVLKGAAASSHARLHPGQLQVCTSPSGISTSGAGTGAGTIAAAAAAAGSGTAQLQPRARQGPGPSSKLGPCSLHAHLLQGLKDSSSSGKGSGAHISSSGASNHSLLGSVEDEEDDDEDDDEDDETADSRGPVTRILHDPLLSLQLQLPQQQHYTTAASSAKLGVAPKSPPLNSSPSGQLERGVGALLSRVKLGRKPIQRHNSFSLGVFARQSARSSGGAAALVQRSGGSYGMPTSGSISHQKSGSISMSFTAFGPRRGPPPPLIHSPLSRLSAQRPSRGMGLAVATGNSNSSNSRMRDPEAAALSPIWGALRPGQGSAPWSPGTSNGAGTRQSPPGPPAGRMSLDSGAGGGAGAVQHSKTSSAGFPSMDWIKGKGLPIWGSSSTGPSRLSNSGNAPLGTASTPHHGITSTLREVLKRPSRRGSAVMGLGATGGAGTGAGVGTSAGGAFSLNQLTLGSPVSVSELLEAVGAEGLPGPLERVEDDEDQSQSQSTRSCGPRSQQGPSLSPSKLHQAAPASPFAAHQVHLQHSHAGVPASPGRGSASRLSHQAESSARDSASLMSKYVEPSLRGSATRLSAQAESPARCSTSRLSHQTESSARAISESQSLLSLRAESSTRDISTPRMSRLAESPARGGMGQVSQRAESSAIGAISGSRSSSASQTPLPYQVSSSDVDPSEIQPEIQPGSPGSDLALRPARAQAELPRPMSSRDGCSGMGEEEGVEGAGVGSCAGADADHTPIGADAGASAGARGAAPASTSHQLLVDHKATCRARLAEAVMAATVGPPLPGTAAAAGSHIGPVNDTAFVDSSEVGAAAGAGKGRAASRPPGPGSSAYAHLQLFRRAAQSMPLVSPCAGALQMSLPDVGSGQASDARTEDEDEEGEMSPQDNISPAAQVVSAPTPMAAPLSPRHARATRYKDGVIGMPAHGRIPEAGEQKLVFRGPRIRVGIDIGSVKYSVQTATGRLAYRGRTANHAAKMAAHAAQGQVVISAELAGPLSQLEDARLQRVRMRMLPSHRGLLGHDRPTYECDLLDSDEEQGEGPVGGSVMLLSPNGTLHGAAGNQPQPAAFSRRSAPTVPGEFGGGMIRSIGSDLLSPHGSSGTPGSSQLMGRGLRSSIVRRISDFFNSAY